MRKLNLITIASLCAVAAVVWSVPASANTVTQGHDKEYRIQIRADAATVPEPATLGLLALGLGGLGLARRRKR